MPPGGFGQTAVGEGVGGGVGLAVGLAVGPAGAGAGHWLGSSTFGVAQLLHSHLVSTSPHATLLNLH